MKYVLDNFYIPKANAEGIIPQFDGFCELILSPWDFAAGSLIVEEAGGMVTDIDGNSLRFDKVSTLLASNVRTRDEFVKICVLSKF